MLVTRSYCESSKNGDKWVGRIYTKGKETYVGSYLDELSAAIARDRYIIDNDMTGHILNFGGVNE
mgnify:CR=1 FL=1